MSSTQENTNDYNHVVSQLQDYMLSNKFIAKQHYNNNKSNNNNNSKYKEQNELNSKQTLTKQQPLEIKVVERFFYPKEKDQLFWCYFIIHHGFSKYEYPGTTYFVNEKTEKFKCIEHMRNNKQQLKVKKIKNIREDVEDELANKQVIGMKTFIALCIAYNINIMYIHKRKCFELIFDEQSPVYVVHCKDNSDSSACKYCYEMNPTSEQIAVYRNTLFKWESVEKPLKAMSAYKLDELQDLCKKMDLDTSDNKYKTKKDLYELLLLNL